jgi:hypothetical protein
MGPFFECVVCTFPVAVCDLLTLWIAAPTYFFLRAGHVGILGGCVRPKGLGERRT